MDQVSRQSDGLINKIVHTDSSGYMMQQDRDIDWVDLVENRTSVGLACLPAVDILIASMNISTNALDLIGRPNQGISQLLITSLTEDVVYNKVSRYQAKGTTDA